MSEGSGRVWAGWEEGLAGSSLNEEYFYTWAIRWAVGEQRRLGHMWASSGPGGLAQLGLNSLSDPCAPWQFSAGLSKGQLQQSCVLVCAGEHAYAGPSCPWLSPSPGNGCGCGLASQVGSLSVHPTHPNLSPLLPCFCTVGKGGS